MRVSYTRGKLTQLGCSVTSTYLFEDQFILITWQVDEENAALCTELGTSSKLHIFVKKLESLLDLIDVAVLTLTEHAECERIFHVSDVHALRHFFPLVIID